MLTRLAWSGAVLVALWAGLWLAPGRQTVALYATGLPGAALLAGALVWRLRRSTSRPAAPAREEEPPGAPTRVVQLSARRRRHRR